MKSNQPPKKDLLRIRRIIFEYPSWYKKHYALIQSYIDYFDKEDILGRCRYSLFHEGMSNHVDEINFLWENPDKMLILDFSIYQEGICSYFYKDYSVMMNPSSIVSFEPFSRRIVSFLRDNIEYK